MRALLVIGVLAVAMALAWIGGELHRQNCIRDDRSDCSVLPWISGRAFCDTHVCVKTP